MWCKFGHVAPQNLGSTKLGSTDKSPDTHAYAPDRFKEGKVAGALVAYEKTLRYLDCHPGRAIAVNVGRVWS